MTALAALEPPRTAGTARSGPRAAWAAARAAATWDLVHGIMAAGYDRAYIESRVGRLDDDYAAIRVAVRIADLADWAAVNPGPSDDARWLAEHYGWTVDLLWADGDDVPPDPGYVDDVAVRRAAVGAQPDERYARLTPAERRAAVAAGRAAGTPPSVVATRTRASGTRIGRAAVELDGGPPVAVGPLPALEPDPALVRPGTWGRPDAPFGNAPAGYCAGCGEDVGLRLKGGKPDGRVRWHSDCARALHARSTSTDKAPTRAQPAAGARADATEPTEETAT